MILFVTTSIFGFVKGFDSSLAEADPDNYYMEREWRVMGNVQFELHEVERIILPRAYSVRVRLDIPAFFGQLHFADAE